MVREWRIRSEAMSMSRARAPTIRLVQGLGVGPPGMCLDSSWELLFMVVITIKDL